MEKIIYEIKPYFFVATALSAFITARGSSLMTASGATIGMCGILIGVLRYDHRNKSATDDNVNVKENIK